MAPTPPERDNAACRDHDPELWFPEHESEDTTLLAKVICLGCPIHNECRDYALAVAEPFGVWGGLDTEERLLVAARLQVSA